jgi:hypothetical protein
MVRKRTFPMTGLVMVFSAIIYAKADGSRTLPSNSTIAAKARQKHVHESRVYEICTTISCTGILLGYISPGLNLFSFHGLLYRRHARHFLDRLKPFEVDGPKLRLPDFSSIWSQLAADQSLRYEP